MRSEQVTHDSSCFCPAGFPAGRDAGRLVCLSCVLRSLKGSRTGQQAVLGESKNLNKESFDVVSYTETLVSERITVKRKSVFGFAVQKAYRRTAINYAMVRFTVTSRRVDRYALEMNKLFLIADIGRLIGRDPRTASRRLEALGIAPTAVTASGKPLFNEEAVEALERAEFEDKAASTEEVAK